MMTMLLGIFPQWVKKDAGLKQEANDLAIALRSMRADHEKYLQQRGKKYEKGNDSGVHGRHTGTNNQQGICH